MSTRNNEGIDYGIDRRFPYQPLLGHCVDSSYLARASGVPSRSLYHLLVVIRTIVFVHEVFTHAQKEWDLGWISTSVCF